MYEQAPPLIDHPRYRIIKLLGSGGMGAVYQAEHRIMERTVALKVISRALMDDSQAIERFHQEVKAAARLAHPNIVIAYDADQAGDVHFLVMEFMEGMSLAQLVEKRGRLPVLHACEYARQAALGLQHAFEQGMVHRDIKPQNLMLSPKGRVKILDFGLARFVSESSQHGGITAQGAVMGTPDYMAPEQAMDARKADIRADIYSLGCTLYFLLTGQAPFPEGTVIQKIVAHLEQTPKPVRAYRSDVPAELAAVLERMMARDPAQRYQKPVDAARALMPFIKPGPATIAQEGAQQSPERATRSVGSITAPAANAFAFDLEEAASSERASHDGGRKTQPRKISRRSSSQGFGDWMRQNSGLAIAAAVGLLFAAIVLAVVVVRITTATGELVIETHDQDVEIVILQNGEKVRLIDTRTNHQVELKAGTYELELAGGTGGLRLSTDRFTLSRGDKKIVEVRKVPTAAGAPAASPLLSTSKAPTPASILPEPGKKTDPGTNPREPENIGRLIIRTDVPEAQVLVKQRGTIIINPTAERSIDLPAGSYDLALAGPKEGLLLSQDQFTLPQGGRVTVTIRRLQLRWPAEDLAEGKIHAPNVDRLKQLFHDDFRDPRSGFMVKKFNDSDYAYRNGRYVIVLDTGYKGGGFATCPGGLFADFACRLVGRSLGPTIAGWSLSLTCTRNPEQKKHGISVLVGEEGKIEVRPGPWEPDGKRGPQVGPLSHKAIKGIDQFNALLVVVRGRLVEVYVNGVAVCDPVLVDRDLTPGSLSVGVHGRKKGARVEFQEITVWQAGDIPTLQARGAVLK